jgi:hypothetical protein
MHSCKDSPVIILNHLSIEVQWSNYNIYSENIPLWDDLPILHVSPGGSNSFFCPLSDPTLRDALRHFSATKNKEIYAKNTTKMLNPVSSNEKRAL